MARALLVVPVILLAACDGGAASSPDGGAAGWPAVLALAVGYQASPSMEVPDTAFPTRIILAALLQLEGATGTLAVGGHGRAVTVPLVQGADGGWHLREPDPSGGDERRTSLEAALAPTGDQGCTSVYNLNVTGLDLRITNPGPLGRITGGATGFVGFSHTDYVGTRTFFAMVGGGPDQIAPAAVVAPGTTGVNPFDGVTIDFAESLAPAALRLEAAGVAVELAAEPAAEPSRFRVPDHLLPFGQTFRLAPAPVDRAGNRAAPVQVTTMADLPAVSRASFEEGPLPPGAQGDVALVTAAEVPGIGDARALFVGPGTWDERRASYSGGRYTTQLTVPRGATRVRAAVAVLGGEGNSSAVWIGLAGPGGPIVSMQGPTTSLDTVPTTLARFPQRGPWTTFEAPLPPGTAGAVYVDVRNQARGCGGFLPPGAVVIDDLRAE